MRSRWERRTRPQGRTDAVYALQYWSTVWVLLLGLTPVAIAMAVGASQGTATEGLLLPADGYPAFTTLSAAMVVPASVLLVACLVGFGLPLEDRQGARRSDMAWLAVFGAAVTLVSLVLDDARPQWLQSAPYVAVALFALVVLLVALRSLLSATRLLPRSWRGTYRADESK